MTIREGWPIEINNGEQLCFFIFSLIFEEAKIYFGNDASIQ
jgi:hypothetical protein